MKGRPSCPTLPKSPKRNRIVVVPTIVVKGYIRLIYISIYFFLLIFSSSPSLVVFCLFVCLCACVRDIRTLIVHIFFFTPCSSAVVVACIRALVMDDDISLFFFSFAPATFLFGFVRGSLFVGDDDERRQSAPPSSDARSRQPRNAAAATTTQSVRQPSARPYSIYR